MSKPPKPNQEPAPAAKQVTRRDALSTALVTGAAVTGATLPTGSLAQEQSAKARRSLRVVHVTDIHIEPNPVAEKGMAQALELAHSLKPDLLFNGGDCIMDALKRDQANVKNQWALWTKILQTNNSLPIKHCLGNHDIWGWASGDETLSKEQLYGKAWALEVLELSKRYYSWDQAGWHFVVLDSSHIDPRTRGYTAKLDPQQMEWLEADLKETPSGRPVCVLSHIPILSASTFLDGDNESSGDWRVPGAWMHTDLRAIKDLFLRHPNVKLCLSGHIHLQDEVNYLGVKYLCNGAVSGGWWNGPYQEFGPALAVIDLFPDGSSTHEMIQIPREA